MKKQQKTSQESIDIMAINGNVYVSGVIEDDRACFWINQDRYDLVGKDVTGIYYYIN